MGQQIVAAEQKPNLLQFQPKNAHNCYLIQNNMFKNIKFLHIPGIVGP